MLVEILTVDNVTLMTVLLRLRDNGNEIESHESDFSVFDNTLDTR